MYKLLKKSDDPKLKDFVGRTVNVHERPDGNYEGMFNNENIIIQKDCLARAKAEEGAKNLIDLFVKGRERLEKKFGVGQCVSNYMLAYEGVQKDGTIGMSIFTNATAQFMMHMCCVILSRLYNVPFKDTFDKVAKAFQPPVPDEKPQQSAVDVAEAPADKTE